jgi:hypothetical protein
MFGKWQDSIFAVTDHDILCGACGAAIEEVDGELRHIRTRARACDLDDPSSLMAQRK